MFTIFVLFKIFEYNVRLSHNYGPLYAEGQETFCTSVFMATLLLFVSTLFCSCAFLLLSVLNFLQQIQMNNSKLIL